MPEPKHTPLTDLHHRLGARLVPFAGYAMPVQYPTGILHEHQHTRTAAGLFDVSHMGQIRVRGDGAAAALERLMPANLQGLPVGRQRYSLLTNEAGGVRDDLMVAHLPDGFLLVVNAACKDADLAYLRERLPASLEISLLADRALLAVQGPAAEAVLCKTLPEVVDMRFMDARILTLDGVPVTVTRSGYTGEDGFEIGIPAGHAVAFTERWLADERLQPAGLGARDSLRLEAGLCLYGHELGPDITVVEAGLNWAVSPVRRPDGERAGGYPGADVIAEQRNRGAPRQRVGLLPAGRAPVREGAAVLDADDRPVGVITSGGFSPTLGRPIACGLVSRAVTSGTPLHVQRRGQSVALTVSDPVFVPHRYRR